MPEEPNDHKTEAAAAVVQLARELTAALAKADDAGVDIVVSCNEEKFSDRAIKQVLVHIRTPGIRLVQSVDDTNETETIQYPEFKDGDGGPGSGG